MLVKIYGEASEKPENRYSPGKCLDTRKRAIMFCYHNFVRVHQTLKTTPAIAMGIDSHKWTIGDLVNLLPLPAGSRG